MLVATRRCTPVANTALFRDGADAMGRMPRLVVIGNKNDTMLRTLRVAPIRSGVADLCCVTPLLRARHRKVECPQGVNSEPSTG